MGLRAGLLGGVSFALFGAWDAASSFRAGLVDVLSSAFLYALTGVLVGGLLVGVPIGLVDIWRVPLATVSDVTPRLVYERDVRSQRLGGLISGLMGGLVGGIVTWLTVAYSYAFTGAGCFFFFADCMTVGESIAIGLVFGVMGGVVIGLVGGLVSWFRPGAARSLEAEVGAFRTRHAKRRRDAAGLPSALPHFMHLLETALARQVLRQAGAVYQFRHADLQDRLADHYRRRNAV
jgi:hypothetical protein